MTLLWHLVFLPIFSHKQIFFNVKWSSLLTPNVAMLVQIHYHLVEILWYKCTSCTQAQHTPHLAPIPGLFSIKGIEGFFNCHQTMSELCSNLSNNFQITKNKNARLPWWCGGWESACQCRGNGFKPWSGKISHAAEQLSPCATTTEPARLKPVLCNKRGCNSERPAHRDEEWPPPATTRESPRTETKTQHSQK